MFDDDLVKDGPGRIELEMIPVESAQSDFGLIHGARLVLLLGTKKDKVITELILGEDLRIDVEMAPKQTDMGNIDILRTLTQIAELDELAECC
ncbi:MAG: hypothetical protein DHS20C01_37720 [marine bacterium B5-7]|nr:MAG: hypothetical protein DHS20C01_37720 [marine bacterium B5-7]